MKNYLMILVLFMIAFQAPVYAEDKATTEVTDQLKVKGVEFLSWLMDTIRATKDVVVKEAPEVVRQLLSYSAIEQASIMVFCFLTLIFSAGFLIFFINRYRKKWDDISLEEQVFGILLGCGGSITGVIVSIYWIVYSATIIAQIRYTPYAYLIHQFVK